MDIWFYAYEIPFCTKKFYDILPSFFICLLSHESSSFLIHVSISIDDSIVTSKVVSFCCFEITWVMSRSDFYDPSSEFHIYHFISDNRDFFIYYREYDGPSDEFLIALIFWMDCDCLIRE